jgi:hypothetical protein
MFPFGFQQNGKISIRSLPKIITQKSQPNRHGQLDDRGRLHRDPHTELFRWRSSAVHH